ncbi:helix-turn-helix transcriptional regulator [Mediterraneibacter sp. NSJ-55]|uniref:Helix-turn-helix transcriptional regulator n=1 Tax=Mediterraneibacter hominis TaxID=2763054 RepID=A0A923LI83_9FIRM|nr:helix-turn-helix transcriptional regulator [Mediterraneibacter hominis]MBC5689263.1 helix-turn-helix transcriptional regulator [Mediterraneibacter hominis]
MISYTPFWKTLQMKNISQYQLIKECGISTGQLSRMRSNQNISTHTINMLCSILDCKVEDILEYTSEVKEQDKADTP